MSLFDRIEKIVRSFIKTQIDNGITNPSLHISLHESRNKKNKFVFIPEIHNDFDPNALDFFVEIEKYKYPEITYIFEIGVRNEHLVRTSSPTSPSNIDRSYLYLINNDPDYKTKIIYGDDRSDSNLVDIDFYRHRPIEEREKYYKLLHEVVEIFREFLNDANLSKNDKMMEKYIKILDIATEERYFNPFVLLMKNFIEHLKSKDDKLNLVAPIHQMLDDFLKHNYGFYTYPEIEDKFEKKLILSPAPDFVYTPFTHLVALLNDSNVFFKVFDNFYYYDGSGQIVVFIFGAGHIRNFKEIIGRLSSEKTKGFGY